MLFKDSAAGQILKQYSNFLAVYKGASVCNFVKAGISIHDWYSTSKNFKGLYTFFTLS